MTMIIDNAEVVKDLHPLFKRDCLALIESWNNDFKENTIRALVGLRSIREQNDRYAQGRTKPGKICTQSRGGLSFHNYGLACDFVFCGKDPYLEKNDQKSKLWHSFEMLVTSNGLISGASFKTLVDFPHVQATAGYNIKQLEDFYLEGGLPKVWSMVDQTYEQWKRRVK